MFKSCLGDASMPYLNSTGSTQGTFKSGHGGSERWRRVDGRAGDRDGGAERPRHTLSQTTHTTHTRGHNPAHTRMASLGVPWAPAGGIPSGARIERRDHMLVHFE